VGDTPSLNPKLGFDAYAKALAGAIRGGRPAQFTIGIYGPWGSGKSSLLNAIARNLAEHDDIISVLFDAWRYESADHIIIPLLHAIYREIPHLGNNALTDRVRSALLSVVRSLTFTLGPVSVSGAGLIRPEGSDDIAALDLAFAKPYQDMRAIADALGDRRIAVLIDDLDRCSPGKVVALLEAINLVMDIPGFIFVVALDYEVLARAVAVRYPHASGHVFIEKMVQVPFRVPRLELPPDGFLSELIPDWEHRSKELPGDFERIAYGVATLGLEANPRQIKRLLNSVLVLLSVAKHHSLTVDVSVLAGLVGLQLRWPAEYGDFVEAVLAGDENPLTPIISDDQNRLSHYAQHFFASDATADSLRTYVQLTQTVAIAASEAGDDADVTTGAPNPEIRDQNIQLLTALLNEHHYSQKTPGVYTDSDMPSVRFRFGKTVIRCEVRRDDRWVLHRSLNLESDFDRASDLIIHSPLA